MPSKKSKSRITAIFQSSAGRTYSEPELLALAKELGARLEPGARILLKGELGAGKSTFARGLLLGLQVPRESEGSPTFAIAHEYKTGAGTRVIHADLYRLDGNERELEATGLLEALWDERLILIAEWLDLFPEISEKLTKTRALTTHTVELCFVDGKSELREIRY